MTKKLLVLFISLMMSMAFFAGNVIAGEATTLHIEADTTSPEVFGDEMRCRVVILDDNGELATTFGGADITDSTLSIQSANYGDDVRFSTQPATDLTLSRFGDFLAAAEKVTVSVNQAWQEFAVNFDGVKEVGDDTITVTLKKGSSTITADQDYTLMAPEADTFVALTGGVGTLPDVLDELPSAQSDKGATKTAGDSTTVDIFAARYYDGDNDGTKEFYYTDNVPDCMQNVTVLGLFGITSVTTDLKVTSSETLTDGHVSTSVPVHDIMIPEWIAANQSNWSTRASQMNAMSWLFANGITVTWSASAGCTRVIGSKMNDVNSNEELEVSLFDREKYYISPTAPSSRSDTSHYKADETENITIVGLPLNQITKYSAHLECGFLGQGSPPKTMSISPLDVFYLPPDPLKKPSGGQFKVAGESGSTNIYGAVVSYDRYDNPAPFNPDNSGAGNVRVSLKKTADAGTGNPIAVNSADSGEVVSPWNYDSDYANAYITNTYSLQSFIPFAIPATNSNGTYASITNCFISSISVDGGSNTIATDPFEDNVGSETLGVDFFAQDYVGAITQTIATDIKQVQQDDSEVKVIGTGKEKSWVMNSVLSTDGSAMDVGPEDSTTGSSSVTIANDKDELAKTKVVYFTTAKNASNIFCIFKGADASTFAVSPVTVTANSSTGIKPLDGGDGEPSAIGPIVKTVRVNLDPEEDHNILSINNAPSNEGPALIVLDAHGNAYQSTHGNSSLEDAELTGKVLKPMDNDTDTASDVEAEHTVDFDNDLVKVEFDLDTIGPDEGTYFVELQSSQGNKSGTIKVQVNAMQSLNMKNKFVAVPGITDTPVDLFFADQAGDKIEPVTITSTTAGSGKSYGTSGNKLDVEFEVDNGTLSGVSTSSASKLSTASPKIVFTAKPSSGKTTMEITADPDVSGLDDSVLSLKFAPDFNKPEVGTPTGIDCGISIPITDDIAVDTAASTVTVKNSDGEDVTDTFTRTDTDSGASGTIELKGPAGTTGTYTVVVVAADQAGNLSEEVTKPAEITSCSGVVPSCLDVDPMFALLGETESVTITGEDTNFADGTTVVSFGCTGVTIDSTTVNSATEVLVNITVADDAAEETCDVTVTTGSEEITCADLFEVTSIAPCIDEDGDGYGENCDAGIDCDDTDADVNPGAEEVCDDGIDNDCSGSDEVCAPSGCSIASVSPDSVRTGLGLLPRFKSVTITGDETADFSDITKDDVDFGASGITVISASGTGNSVRALIMVWGAAKGDSDVSVGDCDGGTFTVQ